MEWPEQDGVVVILKLSPESKLYSYDVSVTPQLDLTLNGSTVVCLKALYDTSYNISVVATHLCGHEVMNYTELFYSEYNN